MGARKLDTVKAHDHEFPFLVSSGWNYTGSVALPGGGNPEGASRLRTERTGTAETAPRHVAFHPRIHI